MSASKKLCLCLTVAFIATEPANSDELPCPVSGVITVTVSGDDTVSGECTVGADVPSWEDPRTANVIISSESSLTNQHSGIITNFGHMTTGITSTLVNDSTYNNGADFEYYNSQNSVVDGRFPPPGLVSNAGTFTNNGLFTNHSGWRIDSLGVVGPDSAELVNTGVIQNFGNLINGTEHGMLVAGHLVREQDSNNLVNDGLIDNHSGGVIRNRADISGSGSIINRDGGLIINEPTTRATLTAGYVENQDTARIENHGTFNVDVLQNEGTFANLWGQTHVRSVAGSGEYIQDNASDTFVEGSGELRQASVSIFDGQVLGDGAISAATIHFGEATRLTVGSAEYSGGAWGHYSEAGQIDLTGYVDFRGSIRLGLYESSYSNVVVDGTLDLTQGIAALHFGSNPEVAANGISQGLDVGATFDLLVATQILGNFRYVDPDGNERLLVALPELAQGLRWDAMVVSDGGVDVFRASVTAVPIPPALLLFSSALALAGLSRRRRH